MLANEQIADGHVTALREINLLHCLRCVRNRETPTSDDDIEGIWLSGTKVTDVGFTALASLKNLEGVWLSDLVTDAGLKSLAGNKLKELRLGSSVTDEGLKELAGLRHLRRLELGGGASDWIAV